MFRNGMLSQYKSQLENTLKLTRARINTDDLKVFIETKTESEKYLNLDEGKALPHDIQEICSVCGSDVHVEGAHVVRNQGSIVPSAATEKYILFHSVPFITIGTKKSNGLKTTYICNYP